MAAMDAAPTGMVGPLLAGLETISNGQTYTFVKYVRTVLPLDGYVFWLRTEEVLITGSLHVSAQRHQNEDETLTVNRAVLTTGYNVEHFNTINPQHIWVGEYHGWKYAFSQAGPQYQDTGIFHYEGIALYPALASQLIDVGSQLSPDTLVVSNSLPVWLRLYSYNPIWVSTQVPNPFIQLFPSYAVPENIKPPYGAVHIFPESTKALGAFPQFDTIYTTQWQLVSERVRVTLYGTTNDQAYNFVSLVNQFSMDTNLIGMMDIVAIRDEKRTQPELGILAMKKTIEYTVSYNQQSVRDVALALIESAQVTVTERAAGT